MGAGNGGGGACLVLAEEGELGAGLGVEEGGADRHHGVHHPRHGEHERHLEVVRVVLLPRPLNPSPPAPSAAAAVSASARHRGARAPTWAAAFGALGMHRGRRRARGKGDREDVEALEEHAVLVVLVAQPLAVADHRQTLRRRVHRPRPAAPTRSARLHFSTILPPKEPKFRKTLNTPHLHLESNEFLRQREGPRGGERGGTAPSCI